MKPNVFVLVFALLFFAACRHETKKVEPGHNEGGTKEKNKLEIVPDQYIVVLKSDIIKPICDLDKLDTKDRKKQFSYHEKSRNEIIEFLKRFTKNYALSEKSILRYYTDINVGFCAKLTKEQFNALKEDRHVKKIYKDIILKLLQEGEFQPVPESDLTPFFVSKGVDMLGGPRPQATTIEGVTYHGNLSGAIWMFDTGIETGHPDLAIHFADLGTSLTDFSIQDNNGHGTMVAGIMVALYDEKGVTGVAANGIVIPIKVTQTLGDGQTIAFASTLLEGFDATYSFLKPKDVMYIGIGAIPANACLTDSAGETSDELLYHTINNIAETNVSFVIPAGNSANCTASENTIPSCMTGKNIYVVGALNEDGSCAAYSSWGNSVAWGACGTYVSTFLNGTYARGSGTSFAAAAVAALLLAKDHNPPVSAKSLQCCNPFGLVHFSNLSKASFDIDVELVSFSLSNVKDGDETEDLFGKSAVILSNDQGSQIAPEQIFWQLRKEESVHFRNGNHNINKRITMLRSMTYDQLRHARLSFFSEMKDEEGSFDPRNFVCQECAEQTGTASNFFEHDFYSRPSTLVSLSDLAESFYQTITIKGQKSLTLHYFESNNENDGAIKITWKVYVKPSFTVDPNCTQNCHASH